MREVQPNSSLEVIEFFAECVRQERKSAHLHAGCQVQTLDMRGRYHPDVWVPVMMVFSVETTFGGL